MSHYFINDDNLKNEEKVIHSEIQGINLSFYPIVVFFLKIKLIMVLSYFLIV